MTTVADRAHAHALVDQLVGPPDAAADRAVAVLHAHAAALAWIRKTIGGPAPASAVDRLAAAAVRLRGGEDSGDPAAVLGQAAVDALTAHRVASA